MSETETDPGPNETGFGHQDIDTCFDILGACILTDRLERDEELVELSNSAQTLARHIAPEIVISRRDVTSWFDRNRDRLGSIAASTQRSRAMLERLDDTQTRRLMLACIYAVCVCDYRMADEESAFIRLALDVWAPETLTKEQMAQLY